MDNKIIETEEVKFEADPEEEKILLSGYPIGLYPPRKSEFSIKRLLYVSNEGMRGLVIIGVGIAITLAAIATYVTIMTP